MARAPDYALAEYIASLDANWVFFQDVIDAGGDPSEVESPQVLVVAGEVVVRPNDTIMVLIDVGGRYTDSVNVGEETVLDIQCRSASYETAFERAFSVANQLAGDPGEHLTGILGGLRMRIKPNTPPTSLGRDLGRDGGRWVTSQIVTLLLKQGENTVP